MRFLFGTAFYRPAAGGGGPIESVSALAEGLVRRGHEVTVLASNRDIPGILNVDLRRDHEIEGVRVRYFATVPTLLQRSGIPMFARSGVFSFGPDFGKWLEAMAPGYDIIHSHIAFLCSNSALSRLARREKKPFLYHQRGNLDPIRLRHGFLKKYIFILLKERPIMRRADVLIALNEYERSTYRRLRLTNRIEVLPNGVRRGAFEGNREAVDAEVAELICRLKGKFVFLFMSRIHPVKGPEIFAEAFTRIAKGEQNCCALMAGPDESGMVDRLQSMAGAAALQDRLIYLRTVTGGSKAAILRRADCFVLPTASEGMSMALLEALGSGCAVITCPGANFPEVETSGAGLVVERSVEAVAVAMNRLMREGNAKTRRGDCGRRLIAERFEWPSIVEKYEELCEELLKTRRRPQ